MAFVRSYLSVIWIFDIFILLFCPVRWWIFPPDDHDTSDPLGEDCAVLNGYLRGEKWGDISCLKKERSICEIPCY